MGSGRIESEPHVGLKGPPGKGSGLWRSSLPYSCREPRDGARHTQGWVRHDAMRMRCDVVHGRADFFPDFNPTPPVPGRLDEPLGGGRSGKSPRDKTYFWKRSVLAGD